MIQNRKMDLLRSLNKYPFEMYSSALVSVLSGFKAFVFISRADVNERPSSRTQNLPPDAVREVRAQIQKHDAIQRAYEKKWTMRRVL